jgi:3-dehydroquinate dehydratase
MREKHFNLSRYKELLQLEEKGGISFLDLELLSYKSSVAKQISYNRKKDYFIVIHQYLSPIITLSEFRSKFLQMKKDDSAKATIILENFQELEVFTLAKDLEKFSDLISQISTLCLEFGEVWDGTMEPMSESEFYSLVNNHYLQ